MRIFDASDPVNPVQVGWIDTFPEDDSAGSGGVWGVYPFLPSGKVVVSDKNRALFVVWPDRAPLTIDFAAGAPPGRVEPLARPIHERRDRVGEFRGMGGRARREPAIRAYRARGQSGEAVAGPRSRLVSR